MLAKWLRCAKAASSAETPEPPGARGESDLRDGADARASRLAAPQRGATVRCGPSAQAGSIETASTAAMATKLSR